MSFDQKIQLWMVVGTWVAGISTFAAVCVALFLSHKVEKVRLKANAGIRLIVGAGTPRQELLDIDVTNLGERPVTINSIGWSIGRGNNKRQALQTVSGPYTKQYPIELAHGKSANFMVSFDASPNWWKDFSAGFVKDFSDKQLKTLKVIINTSIGQSVEFRPENAFLEELRQAGLRHSNNAKT